MGRVKSYLHDLVEQGLWDPDWNEEEAHYQWEVMKGEYEQIYGIQDENGNNRVLRP